MDHLEAGKLAEEQVAEILAQQGWIIEARNWRAPGVEVDIVAGNINRVLIVEVKFRRSSSAGYGYEAVGYDKTKHLSKAASLWQQQDKSDREIMLVTASVDKFYDVDFFEVI